MPVQMGVFAYMVNCVWISHNAVSYVPHWNAGEAIV